MKIQGIIEAFNERAVKLDGRWYKYMKYIDREISSLEEGTEVELEIRKGLVQKLKILNATSGLNPARRPALLRGFTELVRTSYGNLYVTVNTLDGKPFEVLVRVEKASYWIAAYCEAVGRLVSLALRSGIDIGEVVDELQSVNNNSVSYLDGVVISISDAVAQILRRSFPSDSGNGKELEGKRHVEHCPSCSTRGSLTFQGGCSVCASCGFTEC